jgi:two-component system response regulator AtoC
MLPFRIFIVEDDPWYGGILEYHLSLNPDYELFRFETAKDCLAHLSLKPDLVTLDYSLPDGKGTEVLQKIKQFNPDIPVIIISAQENITTVVDLLKSGASDYFTKDDHTKDLLWNAIIRIRENQSLKKEVKQLREELDQKYDLDKLIKGNSPAISSIYGLIEKAARTNINVSVTGETGTGKEVVARAIHYHSDRKTQPFIAINMAAIPAELIESELFGHEKGAFTGALVRKAGKFEEADKGTILLDEIAELNLSLQSKLLRVLQEREFTRVGGNESVKIDVRVIIATHKNLAEEVRKGAFREDLYYRIIGLPIHLPPLRERGNDILLLAKYFADEFCRNNKMPLLALSTDARKKLMLYTFPGNVRELKAIVDLAVVMCNGEEIKVDDIVFPSSVRQGDLSFTPEKTLKEYTNDIISFYLKKYSNNILKTAEQLDIGKSTIYKMIKDKEITL